jgi:di/tripeptidase
MKTLMRLEPKLFLKVSVHPGYAKGKMINSMLIANDFINLCQKETPKQLKVTKDFSCTSPNWHRGNSFRINNQGPQQAKI